MAPIRIAIIDCDPLIEPIRKRYGDYGGVVTAFLHAGAEHIGLPFDELHLTVWSVEEREEYPTLEEIDCILISGSRKSAYDDKEWINKLVNYVKQVLTHDTVKILGLCFGHQVVGRALGAEGAINTLGYEMSVCKVDMTPLSAKMFGKDQLAVHQMHHDILCSYPSGVTPLGTSPVCEVQGMYLPRKFLTLQGHPEFNKEIMLELLKASDDLGFEDKTLYDDAMSRVHDEHDGTLVAAVMLKFLKGELDI